ncbi:MAG: bis(5'-nucleosyl)-tetraphosphatase (symmetrical) YqeK [Clostridia bacterium]|nr:bis(5'-nucleosyl)-tetraphosphatase (symmetrical) YqeK [Clostridia bacterium]
MGKILIFGGTFDPPHKGHRHLLRTALQQEQFDRVLIIPSYIPPHKDHKPALSFEVRKEVIRDFFGEIPGMEILDLEQKRGGRSYTIDTVKTLREENPEDTLYLLIGSDMFLSFHQWYCADQLLRQLILVVGSREPGDRTLLEACKKRLEQAYPCKGIILCDMEPVVCASSDLRAVGNGLAERALAHIGQELDLKRARHTMQVADYARELAPKVGVDAEKAYLAGLLHDCTKCYSNDWQIRFAREKGISLTADDLSSPQILHQITAPAFARDALGVEDEEILAAIGCHTTGKPEMAPLDMLIFFADSCEPSRTYPGVEEIRKAGERDLKNGTLMLLDHVMASLINRKQFLHPKTVAARNYLLKELENNG